MGRQEGREKSYLHRNGSSDHTDASHPADPTYLNNAENRQSPCEAPARSRFRIVGSSP